MAKKNSILIMCSIMAIMFFFFIACKNTINSDDDNNNNFNQTINNSNSSSSSSSIKIANPAAQRCVNDGYKLEPIIENGISVDYMCINPETGLKCEIWKYFRNECSLKK